MNGYNIEHKVNDDGTHRIHISHDDPTEDGPLGNCDVLDFTFTHEGIVIDGVENGVIVGSESATYTEVIDRLK